MNLQLIGQSALRQEPRPAKVRLHTRNDVPGADTVRTHRKASVAYRVLSDAVLAMKTLGPAAKLVLMVLQRFGRDGKPCFPSNGKIAESCGLSVATVKRALPELVEHGLIAIEHDAPGTPKGRRIVKTWMLDPSMHPHFADSPLEGQIEPPPRGSNCTARLGGHDEPVGIPLREPTGTTRDVSSSSVTSLSGEGRDGADIDIRAAVALAGTMWTDVPPETLTAKVATLCRDHGPDNALAALRDIEEKGKPRKWCYVFGTARNMAREGGAIATPSRPKPPPLPPATIPIRIATAAGVERDRWAEWIDVTSDDIRKAIETATPDQIADVRARIDRANSPAAAEPAIRKTLNLPSQT